MLGSVGGGFAPVGGGLSPVSPAAPAGGAAQPAGVEDVGPQGPEGLSSPAGKALAGESGFDGFNAVEEAGKAAGSAQDGLKKAEEVVSQLVNALEQILKRQQQPGGQESGGAEPVSGASGARASNVDNAGHVGNGPLVDEKSNSLFAGLRVVPGCSACMGVPGPHTH